MVFQVYIFCEVGYARFTFQPSSESMTELCLFMPTSSPYLNNKFLSYMQLRAARFL